MRLLRLAIFDFRSVVDQELPADGLVILFGPNSAGKTSVLEAAEQLIAQSEIRRTDPADWGEPHATGSVTFDLPAAEVPGSPDAETYRWLLCGEFSAEGSWDWLGKATSDEVRSLGLDEARNCLAARLAAVGHAGSHRDRMVLARSVLAADAVQFVVLSDTTISMLAHTSGLPQDVVEAARRIAADGTSANGDPLSELAVRLLEHGSALVTDLADSAEVRQTLRAAFPPVIVIDAAPDSLSADLEQAVPSIHDLLWDLHDPGTPIPGFGVSRTLDTFEMEFGAPSGKPYLADAWLEGMSEAGAPVVGGPFGAYATGHWHRVRHSVLAVTQIIEAEANRVAPGFVRDQGTIGIEVIPVPAWRSGQHRIRATFSEAGAEPHDLSIIGAGTARWAAAAIRLACRRLEAGRQVVLGPAGAPVDSNDEARAIVEAARCSPLAQTAVRLQPSDAPGFYIVDEPEAHLHPAAIRSVRDWLTQLARTAATVLVATHSPILLDSTSELTKRILVLRSGTRTELRALAGSLASGLTGAREILGLSEGELLLMTRLALFVEGPHDQIILSAWFGDELNAAGISVYPVHGVDNLLSLAESEIVAALGIRIATLSDDTSAHRTRTARPQTRGERAVTRLMREAAAAGVTVKPVGLTKPDILYYLDAEVCQQAAPRFPGWQTAAAEQASAGDRQPWKKWVTSRYGLSLTRSDVRTLADECRRRGKIPSELAKVVHELAAYAAEPI